MAGNKGSGERELIETKGDKRYVRRDGDGQFSEAVDQGKSLSSDAKQHAQRDKPRNQGDKGD